MMQAKAKKPLIGITGVTSRTEPWARGAAPQQTDAYIRDYALSLEAAGGVPVCLPLVIDETTVEELVGRLDGLLLAGGMDVHPRIYGEQPLPGLLDTDYQLDLVNRRALVTAMAQDKPVLGICRGHQLISAALGGSLYQDISSQVNGCINHVQKSAPHTATHLVDINADSLLGKVLGVRQDWVNSHHHQAVKQLPGGFVASAFSPDKIIEAMEHPGHKFLVGVQWHPESTALAGEENARRLLRAFIEAAAGP